MTTYATVCSGIEAPSVAVSEANLSWKPLWFSEIAEFQSELLRQVYPTVKNLGDMRSLVHNENAVAPDVLIGGTPCQAFSVIGNREGLQDERGNLTLTYVELLDKLDKDRLANGQSETIAVWENVVGVLSSKDNAFGCFLGKLAGSNCELQPPRGKWNHVGCVYGPKRAIAWRVLDAQYFGVAQRRRRVMLVASARENFDPLQVLYECGSERRDAPPGLHAGYHPSAKRADCFNLDQVSFAEELCLTITATESKRKTWFIQNSEIFRMLPEHAELLQGFPLNYTKINYKGKGVDRCPITLRLEALGNSMSTQVMGWIFKRIDLQLNEVQNVR